MQLLSIDLSFNQVRPWQERRRSERCRSGAGGKERSGETGGDRRGVEAGGRREVERQELRRVRDRRRSEEIGGERNGEGGRREVER